MSETKKLSTGVLTQNYTAQSAQRREASWASRAARYALPATLAISFVGATIAQSRDALAQAPVEDKRVVSVTRAVDWVNDAAEGSTVWSPSNPKVKALISSLEQFNKDVGKTVFDIQGKTDLERFNSLKHAINKAMSRKPEARIDAAACAKIKQMAEQAGKEAPLPPEPVALPPPTASASLEVQPAKKEEAVKSAADSLLGIAPAQSTDANAQSPASSPTDLSNLLQNFGLRYKSDANPVNALIVDVSPPSIRMIANGGKTSYETHSIAISAESDGTSVIMPNLMSGHSSYAYSLEPIALLGSGDQKVSSYDWEHVMRRTAIYKRAVKSGHSEFVLQGPIYRGEDSSFFLQAGASFDLLSVRGQMIQLQRGSSDALVPNANSPTSIKSGLGDAVQGGVIFGVRYLKKTGVPMDVSFTISPTTTSYSIGSSILTSDGVSHQFDIRDKSMVVPWVVRVGIPSKTSLAPSGNGYSARGDNVIGFEEVGVGAFGTPGQNHFAYATVSINYNPKKAADTLLSQNPASRYRTLITPTYSGLFGETKLGGDIKLFEMTTIPQWMSVGVGALAGHNLRTKVNSAGGYVDLSLRDVRSSGVSVSLRGGAYGETGGEEAYRLPLTPIVSLSVRNY